LTETKVTQDGVAELRTKPSVKRIYLFDSQ
jgi:hypothetical protein